MSKAPAQGFVNPRPWNAIGKDDAVKETNKAAQKGAVDFGSLFEEPDLDADVGAGEQVNFGSLFEESSFDDVESAGTS